MPPTDWYLRDPATVVFSQSDRCLILQRAQSALAIDGIDVQALAELLEATLLPQPGEALASMAGAETLALLVEQGVLLRGSREELAERLPRRPEPGPRRCRRMVFGISGAVSAAVAFEHVIRLAGVFAEEVDVVLTAGALEFVRPRVFENWGFRTWTDAFEPRHGVRVPHIHLAGADLVLIAPASAGVIHRLASGACSDLLSLVATATAAPVVIAPIMNSQMWRNPAVARNLAQLRSDGVWVIEPGLGFEMAHRDQPAAVGGYGFQYNPDALPRALSAILDASTGDR